MFRTYEPTRDRLVAVKVFRLDITPEQAQSLAEALSRAADASLFHPSIVEPIAAGVEGTSAYRAEEYVAAESLDVALRHYAPAAMEKALPFITQLAGAIDFARAAGIGHGALHPRDIFVTPDEARATGFGVVESLEKVGLRAPVRRPYSAPERVEGAAWTTAADVFSLAAIAYELLTARRPAGTGDRIGALPEDMPNGGGIHQILARAMSDRPEERYLTALAFASALEAAARGERVSGATGTVAAVASAEPEVAPPVALAPVRAVQRVTEAPSREAQEVAGPPAEDEPRLFAADVEEPGRFTRLEDEAVATAEDVLPPALADADRLHAPAADVPLHDAVGLSEEDLVREDPGAFADERPISDDSSTRVAVDLSREPPRASAAAYTRDSAESAAEYPRASVESTAQDISGYPRASGAYPRASVESAADYPRASAESPADYLRESAESAAERPRPAVLPLALTAVLCLLLGFAAGYAVGGRDHRAAGTSQAAASQPTASAPTQPAGKQWSEQTVKPSASAQPPSVAPPVPGDAPAAGGARPATEAPKPRTEALPTSGTLTVRSTPPGAAVTLNGRWRGRTPLTLEKLPFARYVVRVVQPGYAVEREEVALSRTDASRTLSVRMRPERGAAPARSGAPARGSAAPSSGTTRPVPLTGTLFVASNPPGARVFVDGKPVGTAPIRVPDVHIGAHVVRMELPDHRTWSTSTRIVAGQDVRVTGSLERIR